MNQPTQGSTLDLSYRKLRDWPRELGKMEKVERLFLQGNKFTEIPPEIGELTELRELNLSDNKLRRLPPELGRLTKLQTLVLSDNSLEALPDEIGSLRGLNTLDLDNNLLSELPPSMVGLTSLRSLRLNNNRLRDISPILPALTGLEQLSLDGNQLQSLPEGIGSLDRLQYLVLDNNQLTHLPSTLGGLAKLQTLFASNNRLTTLPEGMGGLSGLDRLELKDNQLTRLPDDLGPLGQLEMLDLRGNKLSSLPESILALPALTDVFLYEGQPSPLPLANLVKRWDVFISHASEDKEEFVLPLARQLQRAGLRVWVDAMEMRLGDSIRARVDDGLAQSRFGIIVLSPSFLKKNWPTKELNALVTMEEEGHHSILPIWHKVSRTEVARFSPILADRLAANTSEGVQTVALKIIDAVLYSAGNTPANVFPTLTRRFVELIDRNPSRGEVLDFLSQHDPITQTAFRGSRSTIERTRDLGGALLVKTPARSLRALLCAYLVPGETSGNLFEEDGRPLESISETIDALKSAIQEQQRPGLLRDMVRGGERLRPVWTGHSSYLNTIVAGRRALLSDVDKDNLRMLNEQLQQAGVNIRTYDWLVDVCVSLEEGSTRRAAHHPVYSSKYD